VASLRVSNRLGDQIMQHGGLSKVARAGGARDRGPAPFGPVTRRAAGSGTADPPPSLIGQQGADVFTRSLFESAPDAMLIVAPDGRLDLVNAETERLFGYQRAELIGHPVEMLIPSRYKRQHRDRRSEFSAAPRVRPMHAGTDLSGRRKDGSEISVEISLSPVKTDAGVFTVAAIRDVSQRKRTEQELRDANARLLDVSEGRYRQILETTPDGVWRVDAHYVTDYVNRRMADMLGYAEHEMLGQPIGRFMDPEWLKIAAARIDENERTREPVVVERCFRRKDGSEVWCRVSTSGWFNSDGEFSGSIAVMSDITYAKRHDAKLRSAERLLDAATDSMTEGMYAVDQAGRVTLLNRAAEQLLGWSEHELRGRSAHEAFHYQREDGSPFPIADCPLTLAREAGTEIFADEDVFTRRDGELLPVAYTAAPIITAGVEGSVVVFRDISSRKLEEKRKTHELDQISWVGRIRDALNEDRFVLYAQPIVDLATRNVISHELLLRMIETKGGVIAPGKFLPAAERFDLIQDIDLWVARQAVSIAAQGFAVEFNVSGRSIGNPELIATIEREILATGADPKLIVCEITETALAQEGSFTSAFARRLATLGCRLALDDFGTGYGGFTYLKQLQVDFIKIDIEFIRDLPDNPESQHVVAAIVSLAKAFGQQTIAEGVEIPETLELLAQLGVDHAQGYCIGRPQPCSEAFTGPHPVGV
jgi:PAS domain S-box-containing protein